MPEGVVVDSGTGQLLSVPEPMSEGVVVDSGTGQLLSVPEPMSECEISDAGSQGGAGEMQDEITFSDGRASDSSDNDSVLESMSRLFNEPS
jgi:hypothetical protein